MKMADVIYLSPHLDDVVLSCSGQIFDRIACGESVLVVTLLAGNALEPFSELAQSIHTASDFIQKRRAEDYKALAYLGADVDHAEFQDAIYRRHPWSGRPLYPRRENLCRRLHRVDGKLVNAVSMWLKQFETMNVVVPLAIGHHVDHQIVRLAAEKALSHVTYYEEYPYSAFPNALRKVKKPKGYSRQLIEITIDALAAKFTAVQAYDSQLMWLGGSQEKLRERLGSYHAQVGGEVVWLPNPV